MARPSSVVEGNRLDVPEHRRASPNARRARSPRGGEVCERLETVISEAHALGPRIGAVSGCLFALQRLPIEADSRAHRARGLLLDMLTGRRREMQALRRRASLLRPMLTLLLSLAVSAAPRVDVLLSALDDLEPLFEVAPLIRSLQVDSPPFLGQTLQPPRLAKRLSSPRLLGVRSLELRVGAAGDGAAIELAASAQLRGLTSLELQASAGNTDVFEVAVYAGNKATHQLTDVGALALARSEHLMGLRRLNLTSNGIGLAGVRALIAAPWKLEELNLSNNALEDAAVIAIAGAAELSGVKRLLLGGGHFGARGLEALAKSKTLSSLESIHFTGTHFGSEGLARFLRSLQLPKLTALTLEDTQLGDDGAAAIASSKNLICLTSLELGHNKVTQVGVFALADSPHLVNLERLLLNDAWLGKKAVVEHLAASPTLAKCRICVKGSLLGRAKPKAVKAPAKKAKKKK
jgi:Leucine Rich repeat